MIIRYSWALKAFKKEIGQANHMLITILVGLDGIVPYNLEPIKDFHTSWNPKDKEASVARSKQFAKKATLAWLVDCLDMYLRIINQSPSLIFDNNLKKAIDSEENSRSVHKRIKLMCETFEINSINYALIDLLIGWRNKLTHFQARNDILPENRTLLEEEMKKIKNEHCGLDIKRMLSAFDNGGFPTFKDVASFVRAANNLIYEFDSCLLGYAGDSLQHNQHQIADRVLINYFGNDSTLTTKRLNNVFSKEQEKIEKSIRQILMQSGFSNEQKSVVDTFCTTISQLSCREAKVLQKKGSFIT